MTKPTNMTLRSQAEYSGLAGAGSKHFVGNQLWLLDVFVMVLIALLSKLSVLALSVLFKGQVSKPYSRMGKMAVLQMQRFVLREMIWCCQSGFQRDCRPEAAMAHLRKISGCRSPLLVTVDTR